jgi:uncharacterized membrane protein YdjX (TVP38/TMEM64 family)
VWIGPLLLRARALAGNARMDRREIKTVLLFLGLIAIVAGAAWLLQATSFLSLFLSRERLLGFIEEHHTYAALIFIGLQALQVVAAPVPGEVTGFVGGMVFGPFWGVVYSTAGLTLGSWFAFLLARLLGRPLVERIVSPELIARYDYVMRHKGLFLAFLLFLIPGFPKDYLCYLLGLGHMRQRDFLLVSASGRLLGTTLLTLGGSYFREGRLAAFFTVVGVSLAAILITMIYRERLEKMFRRLQAVRRVKAIAAIRSTRARRRVEGQAEAKPGENRSE